MNEIPTSSVLDLDKSTPKYWDEYTDAFEDDIINIPPLPDFDFNLHLDSEDLSSFNDKTPHIETPVSSIIREEEENSDVILPLLHDDFPLPSLSYVDYNDENGGTLEYNDPYQDAYNDIYPPTPPEDEDDLNDLLLRLSISSDDHNNDNSNNNNNSNNNSDSEGSDENNNENQLMDSSELDNVNFDD